MNSIFLSNIHHAYAQTDGTYKFPNSQEGDMLKQAKKEIEELQNWKKQQTSVESEWDAQKVGKILEIGLGQSIRKNIEPKITKLVDERTNLVNTLKTIRFIAVDNDIRQLANEAIQYVEK